ncbi:glutathione S-transferase family protein [Roseovarius atlanticus]|uniref:glutathione S-transferase family protein n=1 Tax=Roseovarius atlanticus TaxID=1641875 RepID=UPI001C962715|nr:glutathione S-transferase family protein [Roseovarius atlanticus]MBY5986820.1 glutathione S-transferase family protein [Roseovarius atlanticus]MBY6125460.1 glutathione S-transferase family protein [Roseovarius atlanticus]MBY6150079.1 glutathione S-transferase family protein [Roseovarius atlanticus]
MKFYYAPGTIAVATGLLLRESGLDHTPVAVDFANAGQTKPDYLAINPKGRVPALVTDQGILTETGAIAEYIASLVPEKHLVPADPWQAAQMRSICYYLAATMHVNHAHGPRGIRWADSDAALADMKAKMPQTMAQSCTFIEDTCTFAPFVMGEQMTIADPWLFAICCWLETDNVDVDRFPRIKAHRAMMAARPSAAAIRDYGLLTKDFA